MQISLPKTEVTLFSQNNTDNLEPVVTVDNHVLQYNKTPKLLGVHLDEKLNFRKHIEVVSHKHIRRVFYSVGHALGVGLGST